MFAFARTCYRRLLSASQKDEVTSRQRVLVFYNSEEHFAAKVTENARIALDYARMRYDTLDIARFPVPQNLGRYSCLLFCSEYLHAFGRQSVLAIRSYVSGGGGLAVVYRGWNHELADLFGVDSGEDWPGFRLEGREGFVFVSDLFPGFEGLSLSEDDCSGHVPYAITPRPTTTKVIATNTDGEPLAWLNEFGRGRVVYWNSAVLGETNARGLIVQSVACAQQLAVIPIANVGLVHIDDFPPPHMQTLPEPVASEFPGVSVEEFYHGIWYGDMQGLAGRYGLTYSYFAILNYSASPQGEPAVASAQSFDWSGVEKACRFGEVGLHGYNHLPLLLEHWGTAENMGRSLEMCRETWRQWSSDTMPVSYVPPNNEYDAAGAGALVKWFPEIRAICSTYGHGDFERGGSREFGPEPWASELFAIPRATSGFEMHAQSRFQMASQLGTFGVWTHFVHPDDVFDTPEANPGLPEWRNPRTRFWRKENDSGDVGLLSRFEEWLGFANENFPWLRFMDTRSAVPVLKSHLASEFEIGFSAGGVHVIARPGSYFQVRSNGRSRINPAAITGADLVATRQRAEYTVYTFRATAPGVRLEVI